MMRKLLLHLVPLTSVFGHALEAEVKSPDGRLVVSLGTTDGTTRKVVVN